MTLIVLARVSPALRGKLTRWLLEIHAGVFVGTVSARVRERLWQLVVKGRRAGACTLVWRAPTEQGFMMDTVGDPTRAVVDYDGLLLLRRPGQPRAKTRKSTRSLKTE